MVFIFKLQLGGLIILNQHFQHLQLAHLIRFFLIFIYQSHILNMTKVMIALLLLILQVASLSITQRTPQSVTKTFKKFDKDSDGILSKVQARDFFDNQYMKDFEGIDIDPKFIESSFNHILHSDRNKDGIQVAEFIDAVVPKAGDLIKKEPGYYPEEQL